MSIGVVVPVRNARPDDLGRCLRSVSRAIARSSDLSVAVVLSDDSSEKSLAVEYQRLALAHGTEYIRSDVWRGIGGARNLGFSQIRSSVSHVMFVDADDEIDESCLITLGGRAEAGLIVTALCSIMGWGAPYTPPKAMLLDLLQSHHRSRSSPLLYTNVIGQPALLPAHALEAIGGYIEQRYSGEHVDLWGRLFFEGLVKRISFLPKVLYYYHSTPYGNYRRNTSLHRIGVASALSELSRRYFHDTARYSWVAAGRPLPSLYAPTGPKNEVALPRWATLNHGLWSLNMPATKFLSNCAKCSCTLPLVISLTNDN